MLNKEKRALELFYKLNPLSFLSRIQYFEKDFVLRILRITSFPEK